MGSSEDQAQTSMPNSACLHEYITLKMAQYKTTQIVSVFRHPLGKTHMGDIETIPRLRDNEWPTNKNTHISGRPAQREGGRQSVAQG